MKKLIFVFVLALALSFTFITDASAGTVLDRILKKGELVVGTTGTQPPLNAKTKTGKIIGLDADIARLIASNMEVRIKFVTIPFAELLPALEAGKVDMVLSSMTITPKRNLKVAFIGPYYVSGKGILTKADNIASLQDSAGLNKPQFKVAALKNSTSQEFVQKAAPKAQLVTVASYDEALEKLFQGQINALVADYPYCSLTAYLHKDKGLIAGQSRLTFEPLGIAVLEDALLINWVQNFMRLLKGSGQMKIITKRWLEGGSWIKELP